MVWKQGHGKSVDWYLLGVLIFEFLEGIPPYYDHDKETLFSNILNNEIEVPEDVSNEAKDLIRKLLCKDPKKRLGFNGAHEIKQHPWFKGISWSDVIRRKLKAPFPRLLKTKQEHLQGISRKNQKAIEKYNDYFQNIDQDRRHNHVTGWSFIKASMMSGRESPY